VGRLARDHRLESRASRERLRPASRPYWRTISTGCHIGYVRRGDSGRWVARYRKTGSKSGYVQKAIGEADDLQDADGAAFLTFGQAQERAGAWFEELRSWQGKKIHRYTVGNALDDYLAGFTGKSLEKTRHTIERHIRPALGRRPVVDLATAELSKFQSALAQRPSVYRRNKRGVAKLRPEDDDSVRRRRSNANRIFAPLKAALNRAFNLGTVPDDRAWRRIKPYPKVSVARVRYFTAAEIQALLDVAEPWFRVMLQAALMTGGRWSEIHRMRVRDVDLRCGTVLFPETKGGRPRHVHLTDEGVLFFRRICTGKTLSDSIFVNRHGRPLGTSHQIRPMRETCMKAGVEPAGFHILRHTYGSTLAMAGVPLAVIAEAMGHADERITRKHYAHLSPSYVRDAVRAGLGNLGAYRVGELRVVQ
jgi:integrase